MAKDINDHPNASNPGDDPTLLSLGGLGADDSSAALRETPGTRIGPYKLIQLIGEGGFGSVFMAEQERPVVRTVALKIIKLGMDTRQVVARFEQERQALAVMDHPGIARVLDAGATESGRPFFVMELVKGEPISVYCDRQRLPVAARLELFAQVCHAVQHAHTKGIIHRDIKPSNVLVSTQDGKAHAKIIDFGIAKATAAKLTEKTLFTEHRTLIGTPEYMSPEQAEGSLDIDTRSDVYSLGVLLYELMTGSTPFSGRDLRSAGYAEIQRIIREVDPPRPSTRLSQSLESLTVVAERRQTLPKRLGTMIRGELDWIVMRALEKDRHRRYESASAFAADIERFLSGEAVVAAPPSTTYRLNKFVRRHRGAVVAVTAIAASLVVGAVAFAWQARVASQQRDRAFDAERETQKRATELERVTDFQARMLRQIDPASAGVLLTDDIQRRLAEALDGMGVTPTERAARSQAFNDAWRRISATDTAAALIDRTVLQPAVAAIDREFADQPLVEAQLRTSIADLYKHLGLYDAALPLYQRAFDVRERLLGLDRLETIDAQNNVADLFRAQGKLDESERLLRDVLVRSRRSLGDVHQETLLILANLGYVLNAEGKADEGLTYLSEALATQRRVLGDDNPYTLISLDNMGLLLQGQGKLGEAEACQREALDRRRRSLGNDHVDTIRSLSNLGFVLVAQSKFAEAEPIFRETLERARRVLGENHPDTLAIINNMGYVLQSQGRIPQAEPYVREALAKYRSVLGDEHPDTMAAINNLGVMLQEQNRFDEAESLLREALSLRRRVLGEDHPRTLDSVGNVGRLLQAVNRLDEAEPLLRDALEKKRRLRGEDHPDTLTSINNLGVLLQSQGKITEAEAQFRSAMEKCRRVLGADHINTLITTINTGSALQGLGRNQEAVELLLPIESKTRGAFTGSNSRYLAKLLASLGRARAALGNLAEAESNLLEAHPLLVTTRGEVHRDTRECAQSLIDLYTTWEAAEPGKGHDAQALAWKAKLAALPAATTIPTK